VYIDNALFKKSGPIPTFASGRRYANFGGRATSRLTRQRHWNFSSAAPRSLTGRFPSINAIAPKNGILEIGPLQKRPK
jgi:hypothetical protein